MKIARHRGMKRAIVAVARGGWHRVSLDQGRSCGGMTGVSYGGAHRDSTDDRSVRTFAVKPRA
jgi:hypothetical protein